MEDLRRIHRFTLDYQEFPGLRILPLGLYIILLALQQLKVIPWLGQPGDLSITLPILAIVVILGIFIDRSYERKFGKVEPLQNRSPLSILNIALLMTIIGIIVLENILFLRGVAPPFSMIGLSVGLVIFITGLSRRRWYHIVGGLILLIASFFPLIMGVALSDPFFGSIGSVYSFLLGGYLVITALLDHTRFVRTFSAAERDVSS